MKAALSTNFVQTWRQKRMPVFVSFSGGSDSLALLLLLQQEVLKSGPELSLAAVHFEHGIRGQESLEDAAFCEQTARNLGVRFVKRSLNVLQERRSGESTESAARRLRIAAWHQLIDEGTVPRNSWIALAHHADDNAENLFLRIIRGSNVSGLTSLSEIKCVDGLFFVRPLLQCTKKELETFLQAEGITYWCHDKTNDEICCSRNFFRLKVLPEIYRYFPFAKTGILRSLQVLSMDADYLEKQAEKEYRRCLVEERDNRIDLTLYHDLHPAMQSRVLRLYMTNLLRKDFIPDSNLMERLRKHLEQGPFPEMVLIPVPDLPNTFIVLHKNFLSLQVHPLSGNSQHNKDLERFWIWNWQENSSIETPWGIFRAQKITNSKQVAATADFHKKSDTILSPFCLHWHLSTESNRILLDASMVPSNLKIQLKQPGDRMVPFGMHSPQKCKKVFSDSHIPSLIQQELPLLKTITDHILWIPCVRRSNNASITQSTRTILQIDFQCTSERVRSFFKERNGAPQKL